MGRDDPIEESVMESQIMDSGIYSQDQFMEEDIQDEMVDSRVNGQMTGKFKDHKYNLKNDDFSNHSNNQSKNSRNEQPIS